ncbi:MAG: type II toxin-antitoxin system VapC family toxin, partial [Acidobacteriota bacterium]|nr:type II toxin-antitoxin system VapC family toxin [Acidobacteriota bacterium]
MILFLDTSALVKIYIAEPGSDRMREALAREGPKAASVLAFPEIHATFARRRREELLLDTELEQIRLGFADDWEKPTQMPVGAAVLGLVPGLCGRHPLRGADAVHLSSALLLHEEGL